MRKLNIEFIKAEFTKERYKLLTKNYVNAHQKLRYKCPNGHMHSICWNNWQQGQKCLYCAGNNKLTIEFIRSEFAKEGYKLLTKIYKNAHQKLDYICSNGHKHNITWNNWKTGYRCPYCDDNNRKISIEFIISKFAIEDYILLSTEYRNAHQKLDYKCPKGHKHSITWAMWQQGERCPYCARNGKPIIEFIKSEFEKEHYKLLTKEYINSQQKLEYICSSGHKHGISWNNWKAGHRCSYCVRIVSVGEIEVRNFIKSLGIKVSPNDRNQIFNPDTGNGLELDIFVPNLNKAIEYNGEYWHQDRDKDLLKQQLCKSEKINLLTIWENEWKTKRSICKNKIKEFLFDIWEDDPFVNVGKIWN